MARRIAPPLHRSRRTPARSFFVRRFVLVFVGVVFIAGVLSSIYYGTRVSVFQVSTVLVQGGTTISPMAVRSVVEEVLDGSYFGLIPHRFTYRIPREEIERRLREIPRLADVRITQPHRTELAIEFEEYQPSALWCNDDAACMFIDTAGFAFAEAPASLVGSLYPRIIIASSSPGYAVRVPQDVALGDMLALRSVFAQYKLSLVEARYVDEYDVWCIFTGGSIVKMRRNESTEVIAQRLEQLFLTSEYASLPKVGFKSIDLRFGNRVYVRDNNAPDVDESDSVVTPVTTTATTTSQEGSID